MRVLFDHSLPFLLAHGGEQTQIEKTKEALESHGVDVEYLRWWDDSQRGDIIHYFGRPTAHYIHLAHQKGMKVVVEELLSGPSSRSPLGLWAQKWAIAFARKFAPAFCMERMGWDTYRHADRFIALTRYDASLMSLIFSANHQRVSVVPNGVEDMFFNVPAVEKEKWLICTASIVPRKRVVELAEAAMLAKIPVWIIGKPFSEKDAYYLRFLELAKDNPDFVRYEGAIQNRAKLAEIYGKARGFVLLSRNETLSLSILEAVAAKCPLLLSDAPWARNEFKNSAAYCPMAGIGKTAEALRLFYENAPKMIPSYRVYSWNDVGNLFKEIYNKLSFQSMDQGI